MLVHQERTTRSEELARLRSRLWHPELVDEAVRRAEATMAAGARITERRRLESFYGPIVALQERFGSRPVVEYALQQTLASTALDGSAPWSWWRYTEAVCERRLAGSRGRSLPAKARRPPVGARREARAETQEREPEGGWTGELERAARFVWDWRAQSDVGEPGLEAVVARALEANPQMELRDVVVAWVRPVLELQGDGGEAGWQDRREALRCAFAQVLRRRQLPHSWEGWLRATVEAQVRRPATHTNADVERERSPEARYRAVKEMLSRARELNAEDKSEAARELLSDILSESESLVQYLNGSKERVDVAIRECFKRGKIDLKGVAREPRHPTDYYPEWEWPAEVSESWHRP